MAGAFSRYASGKAKRVEAVQVNGETLYRTAFAGFSRDDARAFCQALKAAGRDCIVK
ncbi:MAG TPA: SPOR domain-containing protein [Caulobacteraceae bacterium]|nr:SPOR domain-containing protein [Caulobacteraceae bacterium]